MSIKLRILGSMVKVAGDVPVEIHQKLDGLMQFKPDGVEWCDAVKGDADHAPTWDGIVHLYRNREFPVGLLERAEMLLMLERAPYEVVDSRVLDPVKPIRTHIVLRDYQRRIVEDAVRAKSALIPAATGSGKTLMAAEIIARLGQNKALFVVPTIEILDQTQAAFATNMNCGVGWVGDGEAVHPEGERVTVITWQSIAAGLRESGKRKTWRDFLAQYNVIFFDEVHHVSSDAVYEVALYSGARFRYGLSGTLFRVDHESELKFYGAIGEAIKGITASELIALGYLVAPHIRFIKTKPRLYGRRDKWMQVYKESVVENVERNRIVVEEAFNFVRQGRRTLVLVSQIRHGSILKQMMMENLPEDCAVRYEFLNSKAKERADIVQKFRNGTIQLLISTPILDEGVDFPEVQAIILAGAGKSQVKAVQRVGRGLRICPEIDKKDVKVIDFTDGSKYLYEHSHERYDIWAKEPRFKITGDIPK